MYFCSYSIWIPGIVCRCIPTGSIICFNQVRIDKSISLVKFIKRIFFFTLIENSNIFEIRVDAKKFLLSYKRSVPKCVSDIGIWNNIVQFLGMYLEQLVVVLVAVNLDYFVKFYICFMAFRKIICCYQCIYNCIFVKFYTKNFLWILWQRKLFGSHVLKDQC